MLRLSNAHEVADAIRTMAVRVMNPPERQKPHLSLVKLGTPRPKDTITREHLTAHILAMGVIYPARNAMTEEELILRYQIFYDDLRSLSEGELASACERYRKNPDNRFFPTPGQLLRLAR